MLHTFVLTWQVVFPPRIKSGTVMEELDKWKPDGWLQDVGMPGVNHRIWLLKKRKQMATMPPVEMKRRDGKFWRKNTEGRESWKAPKVTDLQDMNCMTIYEWGGMVWGLTDNLSVVTRSCITCYVIYYIYFFFTFMKRIQKLPKAYM